ncbi:hypothetical protein M885DRAFT_513155 [Pelagophyceae sp. CCMP2097]|nr:hypothetical protein M885DRAFT_513155 [Pelagophyceae sp. CCMP2097]
MATVVNLSHLKDVSDGREPWERPAFSAPVVSRRIPWEGGKITSNKDDALVKFLKRKQERGETLNETQRAALVVAARGTPLEGKSDRDVLSAAAKARVPVELPSKKPAVLQAMSKRQQRQQPQNGRGRGRGGNAPAKKTAKRPSDVARKPHKSANRSLVREKGPPTLTSRLDGGLSSGR